MAPGEDPEQLAARARARVVALRVGSLDEHSAPALARASRALAAPVSVAGEAIEPGAARSRWSRRSRRRAGACCSAMAPISTRRSPPSPRSAHARPRCSAWPGSSSLRPRASRPRAPCCSRRATSSVSSASTAAVPSSAFKTAAASAWSSASSRCPDMRARSCCVRRPASPRSSRCGPGGRSRGAAPAAATPPARASTRSTCATSSPAIASRRSSARTAR